MAEERKEVERKQEPEGVGYSYVRFSDPEQSKGDSLRRQTEGSIAWCQRNNVRLDESTTFRDLGKSAFLGEHRKNPDRYALAAFLKLVEEGRIPRGAYLIIENLDRLSREEERPALRLWMDILDAGINIVQLTPETVFRHEKSDMFDIMRAIMELSRGHRESARKSERVGAAWQEKRRRLRSGETQRPTARMGEDCRIVTHRVPAWIVVEDGAFRLIADRAVAIQRIFQLASEGLGYIAIIRRLNQEGIAAFGERVVKAGRKRSAFAGHWTLPYVARLLNDRRVLGEYQPCGRGRKPDGSPIAGYYPAVVGEAEWWAARRPAEGPRPKTRVGKYANLFAGLITNARNGERYIAATKDIRVLVSYGSQEGRSPSFSFPLKTFEDAFLRLLREIDPEEILDTQSEPDEQRVLQGRWDELGREIELLKARLASRFSDALADVLERQEGEQKEVAEKLKAAQEKAAHPLDAAWQQYQTLYDVLATAEDQQETRHRLRTAIRRVVESIYLLVVPRNRDRLAAVQVHFQGGACREYLIFNIAAGRNRKGGWRAKSLACVFQQDELDFRKQQDVDTVESVLLEVNPATIPW